MQQLRWIGVLWVMVAGVCVANVKQYDFTLRQGVPAQVRLDFEKQNLSVTVGKRTILLEHFKMPREDSQVQERVLEDFSDAFPDIKTVIFNDYNFDGYNDIGILMGIGNSGENAYRDYYFYNPATKTYRLQIQHACNLDIFSKQESMLRSVERSGTSYYRSFYRIDAYGKALLVLQGVGEWSHNEEEGLVYTYRPSVTVGVKRAYFYAQPGKRRTKVYIVKKDRVTVLDVALATNQSVWVKVAYRAKARTYRGWVKARELHLEQIKDDV